MNNKTLSLPWKLERTAPPFEGNDIKSPESLARHVLKTYSKKPDKIFDPFAGMGTTLFTAEELNRDYFGMEAEEQKHQWVAGQLENWMHHINDDAAKMDKYKFPKMDLIFTSPPYMLRGTKWNPLYGGDSKYAGYDKYLKRMGFIFGKCKNIMKAKTPLIIQLDNIQTETGKNFTPLVSDITNAISKDFTQTDQITILWKNPKPDYPHTNLLIFKKNK